MGQGDRKSLVVSGGGGFKKNKKKTVEQQMLMDGDQVHFLPLQEVSRCCFGTGLTTHSPVCRLRGKAWGCQPCLPRGPPCLRRQDPSSVSRAIFTKAWKLLLLSLRLSCEETKHRQIPSLETQMLRVPDRRRPLPFLHEAAVFYHLEIMSVRRFDFRG